MPKDIKKITDEKHRNVDLEEDIIEDRKYYFLGRRILYAGVALLAILLLTIITVSFLFSFVSITFWANYYHASPEAYVLLSALLSFVKYGSIVTAVFIVTGALSLLYVAFKKEKRIKGLISKEHAQTVQKK